MSSDDEIPAESDGDQQHRREVHANARKELLDRLASNSENYDRAILTLASAMLALSVTFMKELLPSSPIHHVWLLYGSWSLLTCAIINTVLSFRISDAALFKQLDQIDRYYVHRDDTALARTGLARLVDLTNTLAGIFFVAGIVFTVFFAGLNFSETRLMTKTPPRDPTYTRDGQTIPNMQKVGADPLKRGQSIPNIQVVGAPATKPATSGSQIPNGSQTTSESSSAPQSATTPTKK